MIQPVNNHLLIEPLEHKSFMSTEKGKYEEIGTVIRVPDELIINGERVLSSGEVIKKVVKEGTKVYFDSWRAAKYQKPNGGKDEFYWFVLWDDIRAIDNEQ